MKSPYSPAKLAILRRGGLPPAEFDSLAPTARLLYLVGADLAIQVAKHPLHSS